MSRTSQQKTIIVHAMSRDIETYRLMADEAVRLKPYGRVLILVGNLADKWWDAVPPGGSPWHEYASYNPTFFNVFPHPMIAPHLDMDWVKRNQDYLARQLEVVRERELGAYFYSVEPSFLPESFFVEHPHLRGPRVDHPRRATREAFAMCVDLEETRELYAWMTAELKRHVPELGAISFKVNDAGSGFCWAASQYAGPNGPQHCRGRTAGQRFRDFAEALQEGARRGGGEVLLYNTASAFWQNERPEIQALLPPKTAMLDRNPDVLGLGGMAGFSYPVLGLVNPLRLIRSMERWDNPKVENVLFHFRVSYDRAHETHDIIEKVIDIVEDCRGEPTDGYFSRREKLRKFATRWGGDKHAETITEAFEKLDEVFHTTSLVTGRFRPMYAGVAVRHITRPLLIRPEVLTPEEESYFLPHIFNIRTSEARTDYIDMSGVRPHLNMTDAYYAPGLTACVKRACEVAAMFESAADAPEGEWLGKLAVSLRMWASVFRSIHNFYCVQKIRDDYKEELAGEPVVPEKVRTETGHPATLPYYYLLRDELDNANELIALLERGGLDRMAHAEDARHEDTFVLGPDLVGDLKRKVEIMREHWRDVERYLPPPHK